MRSLKGQFFYILLFLILFSALSFGLILTYTLYKSEIKQAKELIYQKNKAVSFFVESYFKKFYITLDFLSTLDNVINAQKLKEKEKENIINFYKKIQKIDPDINYLYSAYENGSILIYNYTPPEGFNPKVRPWYKAAIESYPKISNGIPYKEIKTKEWLVSMGKALYDKNGNLTGVVAIDTSVNKINELINKKDNNFDSLYSYILNKNQEVIFHPNKEYISKAVKELVNKNFDFSSNEGYFEYKLNKYDKIAYYTNLDFLGWTVVTVVNKEEIILKIIHGLFFPISIVVFISISIGIWLTFSLYGKIISPITKLKERIQKIANGHLINNDFRYPDNEIGIIAHEVEKFTEKELYRKNIELLELNKKLKYLSERDQLTDLYNRHKMNKEIRKHYYNYKRYGRPFSLLMVDIDKFKKINDTYGHMVGDEVLKKLAKILVKNVRKSDIVSRWGGEEFLILLSETNLEQAIEVAEKIRKIIETEIFPKDIKITVSIGVDSVENYEHIKDLLIVVDEKLYKAKENGRNRVEY
ncbi:sensor domain-containing diguanylate cyclase [Thermosipho globiformans]|uniref:sensor domain-containing diguanylate cyclase n=1 Tax=Thermosipho globiformans TaxID=380685 RepID=UPI000F8E1988|nr:diguanylate cyclase [Thermosipho globiformans]